MEPYIMVVGILSFPPFLGQMHERFGSVLKADGTECCGVLRENELCACKAGTNIYFLLALRYVCMYNKTHLAFTGNYGYVYTRIASRSNLRVQVHAVFPLCVSMRVCKWTFWGQLFGDGSRFFGEGKKAQVERRIRRPATFLFGCSWLLYNGEVHTHVYMRYTSI